jgi:hypothetical protein
MAPSDEAATSDGRLTDNDHAMAETIDGIV